MNEYPQYAAAAARAEPKVNQRIKELESEINSLRHVANELGRVRSGAMDTSAISYGGGEWQVWVTPYLPEHFKGDAIVAPYGMTYWADFATASEFLARRLEEDARIITALLEEG